MKKILFTTIFFTTLLGSLFLFSCAGKEQSIRENKVPNENDSTIILSKSLSKSDYNIIPNSTRDYSIYISKIDSDKAKEFYLVNSKIDTVLFKDKLINGEIKWITEFEFSVIEFPGMIKEDDDKVLPKYTYNVLTNKKN